MKIHGKGKRRTWRKFHIGINATTQDVVVWEMTKNNEGDGAVTTTLLDEVKGKIDKAYGDGAYDGCGFRKKVYDKGGRTIVPPPRSATYKPEFWVFKLRLESAILHLASEGKAFWVDDNMPSYLR